MCAWERNLGKKNFKANKTSHWTLTIHEDNFSFIRKQKNRNSFIHQINILESKKPQLKLKNIANELDMASVLLQKPSFVINWDYFQWD